jgi:hypothetical protein
MKSRERLRVALNHGKPDRVPWSPNIGEYFMQNQEPEVRALGAIGVLRAIGSDILVRHGVALGFKSPHVQVVNLINGQVDEESLHFESWREEILDYLWLEKFKRREGCIIEKRFITPVGILTARYCYKAAAGTVFQTDFPIKSVDDISIFRYMVQDLLFYPTYEPVQEQIEELGEEGLVAVDGLGTPMAELIENFMGLEGFIFMLHDHPEEVGELLSIMAERYYEAYEIIAASPAELVIAQEDVSTTLYGPSTFATYGLPVLRTYAQIVHQRGKRFAIHACGHLKGLLPMLRETGADAVEALTPLPTGDVTVAEAQKMLGKQVCIIGGLDPTVLAHSSPDALRRHVVALLGEVAGEGNFILGTGDATPADTPLENLKAVTEAIKEAAI